MSYPMSGAGTKGQVALFSPNPGHLFTWQVGMELNIANVLIGQGGFNCLLIVKGNVEIVKTYKLLYPWFNMCWYMYVLL